MNTKNYFLIVAFIVALYILIDNFKLVKIFAFKQIDNDVKIGYDLFKNSELFDVGLWKDSSFSYVHVVPQSKAMEWSTKIWDSYLDSVGFFTNKVAIFEVFGDIYNQVQISQMSDSYTRLFNQNLKADLEKRLNKKELAYLMYVISKKPIAG